MMSCSKKRRTRKNSTDNSQNNSSSSTNKVNEIDEALGFFFFGCNIPFNVVESIYFKKLINTLNSDYKPPTRKYLADALLNRVHNKISEDNKTKLNNTDSVLLLDGWKNSSSNTKNVVAILHNVNDNSKVFLESFDISNAREDTEKLQEIVHECIALSERLYNTRVYAIITDNASTMISMSKQVNLWSSTCSSHSGNLLLKSLADKGFVKQVNELLKEFKSSALEKELVLRGGKKVKLACETRWCSYRNAFAFALESVRLMKQLVDEGIAILKQDNKEVLENEQFELQLQQCIDLWDPVCVLINKCQQANCNIADAVNYWLQLPNEDVLQDFKDVLQARINKALWPAGLTAYLLHPVYKGELLSEEQLEIAGRFLAENLNKEGDKEFSMFSDNKGIFSNLRNKNIESPHVFWTLAQQTAPNLSKLARKLFNMPAATAEIERLFSNWAYVHSLLRNRLKSERSKKLINVYYYLHNSQVAIDVIFPEI